MNMARYAAARYRYLGIKDMPVTANQAEYVDIAVRLGTDEEYRHKLISQIRNNYSKLLDQNTVIREYERFFEEAVCTHSPHVVHATVQAVDQANGIYPNL